MTQKLKIADREIGSRLFLCTGKFRSNEEMKCALEASGAEMVTLAMKRVELDDEGDDMLCHVKRDGLQLLPNTSGVRDADEAVFAAQLSREAYEAGLPAQIHSFEAQASSPLTAFLQE